MTSGTLIGKQMTITVAALMAVAQLFGGGLKHYQDAEYEEAVAAFTKVIERYATNPYTDDAHYWRGLSYLKLGKTALARKDLLTVVRDFPTSDYAAQAEVELVKHFVGDDKVKGTLQDVLDKLVTQLGAHEFATREQAQKRLTELGEIARPVLEVAARGEDPEIQMRAARILADLKEKRLLARLETLVSFVTLKADDVPVSKVLDEIQRQTGNQIEIDRGSPNGRKITCDFDKVPFWQALEEVCQKGQLSIQNSRSSTGAIRLRSGSSSSDRYPTTSSGCCRFMVNGINRSYNFRQRSSQLSLSGQFFVEPRLKCLAFHTPQFNRIIDDAGNECTPSPSGSGVQPMSNRMYGHWNMSFKDMDRQAIEIAQAEGTVVLVLPLTFGTLEVKDITEAKDASARGDNCEVTVKATNTEGGYFNVDLSLVHTSDAGAGGYSSRQSCVFSLLDKNGKDICTGNMNSYSTQRHQLRTTLTGKVRFQVPAGVKPQTLRIRYPARCVRKTVSFQLKHIPVP